MFQKRHYEWLARWAGENLTPAQIAQLAADLRGTNPNYNRERFQCKADDINAIAARRRYDERTRCIQDGLSTS